MSDFLSRHRLADEFRHVAREHFLPLAERLPKLVSAGRPLLLGINGAQGTGKSTLGDFLQLATESLFQWNVAVLSLDDFYYTRTERKTRSRDVHPLLETRGVPGTHDMDMLSSCINRLRQLDGDECLALPRFDKASDDRAAEVRWPVVKGPIDLIILEGWCVGTKSQSDAELAEPVNALERNEDTDGSWRKYVNDQLRDRYEPAFREIDYLVFLRAPSFAAIRRWRIEQEEKLAAVAAVDAAGVMDTGQIDRFLQFYERLTRANLASLPSRANQVFDLDEAHSISS